MLSKFRGDGAKSATLSLSKCVPENVGTRD